MNVWKKSKGNRIRASDKSLIYHFLYWLAVAPVCCGILATEPATASCYRLERI